MNLRAISISTLLALSVVAVAASDHHSHNILISDQFNNRVIEVDTSGNIVWSFGNGSPKPGSNSVGAPNDAERIFFGQTLISGTGTTAVPDNRVIIVDSHGGIVWQYGQAGVTGSGANQLNTPVCSVYLPNGDILITDQGNQRIIEVNQNHAIDWQYGQTGVAGAGLGQLNNPNSAELLANGDVLIADESNNRVIEVDQSKHIVWSYGSATTHLLNGAAFASRLDNGDTIISDAGNNRIVEVNSNAKMISAFYTNARKGSNANPNPTRAVRLRNGNTLISDQFNNQVFELDSLGAFVFVYGELNAVGNGPNQLNAPYDAKEIDDFTGLTPPFFGWN